MCVLSHVFVFRSQTNRTPWISLLSEALPVYGCRFGSQKHIHTCIATLHSQISFRLFYFSDLSFQRNGISQQLSECICVVLYVLEWHVFIKTIQLCTRIQYHSINGIYTTYKTREKLNFVGTPRNEKCTLYSEYQQKPLFFDYLIHFTDFLFDFQMHSIVKLC